MTEERLKEIKDSLDKNTMLEFSNRSNIKTFLMKYINQEVELYNEVVRLREIINHAEEVLLTTNNIEKALNVLDKIKELEND